MGFTLLDLENKLAAFFEKKLPSIINKNPLIELSDEFIEEFEEKIRVMDGTKVAPNIFRICIQKKDFLNSEDLVKWKEFAQQLISEIIRNDSYKINGPIKIDFIFNLLISVFCKN